MQDSLFRYLEGSRQAVRYWWLLLAGGVILFLIGVVVFAFPVQSYVGMAVLFGWLMLLTGVVETIVAVRNTHYVTGRGWMLAWGVIEIVLGLILVFNVAHSIADVQYMLAVVASRLGDEEQAVQYFLRAVELRQNLKFRGNLDPEISRLIRKYGLFREDFE